MIQSTRIRALNNRGSRQGRYVLYWMQQSQRAESNHALEYAIEQANARDVPVVVVFGLMDAYPEANERHYAFMLEGLSETGVNLESRGIRFVLRRGEPPQAALDLASAAALVVADCGYLRHQRAWRERVARKADCPVVQVESDAVVPVEAASTKDEFAARTIRPKITRLLPEYLVPLAPRPVRHSSLALPIEGEDWRNWERVLSRLTVDRRVGRVRSVAGGITAAARLQEFVDAKLASYARDRNDPSLDGQSGLSPYLHFGQLSPLQVALAVSDRAVGAEESAEALLEELIVRRELAINYAWFGPDYDRFEGVPEWARTTLEKHRGDRRDHIYGMAQLEQAQTHDPFWNAAMTEMLVSGRMHGYMRMYWGKKILEWTADPAEAFAITLALNNKYFIDGRDPASYASVAWLYGKHDRPWGERPIFGTVRYMNAAGLRRKFDMDGYLGRVARLG